MTDGTPAWRELSKPEKAELARIANLGPHPDPATRLVTANWRDGFRRRLLVWSLVSFSALPAIIVLLAAIRATNSRVVDLALTLVCFGALVAVVLMLRYAVRVLLLGRLSGQISRRSDRIAPIAGYAGPAIGAILLLFNDQFTLGLIVLLWLLLVIPVAFGRYGTSPT